MDIIVICLAGLKHNPISGGLGRSMQASGTGGGGGKPEHRRCQERLVSIYVPDSMEILATGILTAVVGVDCFSLSALLPLLSFGTWDEDIPI